MVALARLILSAASISLAAGANSTVRDSDVTEADLIVALAIEHVAHVRRVHPEAAARTGTLKRLVRDLPGTTGSLSTRLESLGLAAVELEDWEDVVDPAGGEVDVFVACAVEVGALVDALGALLSTSDAPSGRR